MKNESSALAKLLRNMGGKERFAGYFGVGTAAEFVEVSEPVCAGHICGASQILAILRRTDERYAIALAALPNMLAVLVGILINNARLNDTNMRIADTNTRIAELRVHLDSRFDDMRDTWRSELRRVEEVIDARLKHLEDRS